MIPNMLKIPHYHNYVPNWKGIWNTRKHQKPTIPTHTNPEADHPHHQWLRHRQTNTCHHRHHNHNQNKNRNGEHKLSKNNIFANGSPPPHTHTQHQQMGCGNPTLPPIYHCFGHNKVGLYSIVFGGMVVTYRLNNIYSINNHICHPPYQRHHLDKQFISAIVNQTQWSSHKITIQEIQAHTSIIGNEMADQVAYDITTLA